MLTRFVLVLVLFFALPSTPDVSTAMVVAQTPKGPKVPIRIRFEAIPTIKATAGDTVWIKVKTTVDKGYYTYSTKKFENAYGLGPDNTTFSTSDKSVLRIAGAAKDPKVKRVYDSGFETEIEKLSGTFTWEVPVRISSSLQTGKHKVDLLVQSMICDTLTCLPMHDYPVPLTFDVTASNVPMDTTGEALDESSVMGSQKPGAASAAKKTVPVEGDAQAEIASAKREGIWGFFAYAMGVGFLALLTPCVFPMIPITVSFFTKRNEKARGKAVRDAFLFATGIVATFTLVGIVVSGLFGGTAVQDLAANSILNLGIAILFIVLAFNLFGAFEIQVPTSIMNKLNRKSQGDGLTSVLLMGLVFSLTSFTCTVPFVGTVLLSASDGDYLYPTVGMLGFATAFALPFFFLALFPSLLVALPRAGGWMNNLKVTMGFLELAAAVKFVSTAEFVEGWGILPRELFLAIWAGIFVLIALYVLGAFRMKLDSPLESVSALRAVLATIFMTLAIWFMGGMLGKPLAADLEALLPPDNYREIIDGSTASTASIGSQTVTAGKTEGLHALWLTNLDSAKKIAAKENKPIFIDFTGFSCTNCRLMEKDVFTKPAVEQTLRNFVLVQLYTDRKKEPYISNQRIMQEFGTVANPLYVILRPDGSYIAQTGYLPKYRSNPQDFIAFLKNAL